jgi:alginate O-acetyltransferase complex protein AlgI
VDFISLRFVVFLAVAVPLYLLCPLRLRPQYLLVVSYGYYCFHSVVFAGVLFAITAFSFHLSHFLAAASDEKRKTRLLASGVYALVGYLAVFKYGRAILDWLSVDLSSSDWSQLGQHLWMPLGISYYTFKVISYLVDVYWGRLPPAGRFVNYAAFVVFFPQIVAGPIQRATSFLPQVDEPRDVLPEQVTNGLRRILFGLFKKVVVANNLTDLVDPVFVDPSGAWGSAVLIAIYLYPLQLYADFSGLTDIAIGVGNLFGIEAPENFNLPFFAKSISEFWRRWHMTLTQWLVDYVFTPLRMATRNLGQRGLIFSLMVNMLAVGVWHGPRWTYAVFGLLHGAFIVVDTLSSRRRNKLARNSPTYRHLAPIIGPIFTFHLVAFAGVFFRAETVGNAVEVLEHLPVDLNHSLPEVVAHLNGLFDDRPRFDVPVGHGLIGIAGYVMIEVIEVLRRQPYVWPWFARWATYEAGIVAIALFGLFDKQQFIYFQF